VGPQGDHGPLAGDAAPWRRRPDSEVSAATLAHLEERRRIEELRRDLDVEQAKLELQRRGRVVYRASVNGGRNDRWFVSGMGGDVTDAQLIEKAEQLLDREAERRAA
jgi:hypothetical protein